MVTNHGYKTNITEAGKMIECRMPFIKNIISGVVIYKIQEGKYDFGPARDICDKDSAAVIDEDSSIDGFLHLPIPKNAAENQIYADLADTKYWLDITEVIPRTSPRSWEDRNGEPITFFNWGIGEPSRISNAHGGLENLIEAYEDGLWNDQDTWKDLAICTLFLPAGAEDICTWLQDFQS